MPICWQGPPSARANQPTWSMHSVTACCAVIRLDRLFAARRCGIVNVSTALQQRISASRPILESASVSETDHGQNLRYPRAVAFQIKDDTIDEYVRCGGFLNAGRS